LWKEPEWCLGKTEEILTPKKLKRKILIKSHGLSGSIDQKQQSDTDDIEKLKQGYLNPLEILKLKKQLAEEEANDEEEKEETEDKEGKQKHKPTYPGKEALKRCVHVPSTSQKDIKGTNREWEVTSIEEEKALEGLANLKNITKHMLVRTYPRGTRFDSSNYNPLHLWAEGCQIVALNYHTDGFPMWLNEGKFMRAGRTGWILKPPHLHEERNEEDDERGKVKEKKILDITVISGWRLPRPWGTKTISSTTTSKPSKPKVEVSHWTPENVVQYYKDIVKEKDFDVPMNLFQGDTNENGETKYVYYTKHSDNPHNPNFYVPNQDQHKVKKGKEKKNKKVPMIDKKVHFDPQPFSFQVTDPELEMIVFKVFDNSADENILGVKMNQEANKIIGYYAITVADMRKGIRVVPLKGEMGAPLVAGDLLVKIDEKDE